MVYLGSESVKVSFDRIPSKQRPRMTNTGHVYTPRGTKSAETAIKGAWISQVGFGRKRHADEVRVTIIAERPLAKTNPKKMIGSPDLMTPDCDNIAKLVCDALNELAYVDDKQITELHVFKLPRPPFGNKCSIGIKVDYYKGE